MMTRRTDSDTASHLPETDVLGSVSKHQRHRTDEPRSPPGRRDVLQLAQQQSIVLLIAGAGSGPPRRPYAGHLVEHANRKSRIIGQRRQAGGRDTGPSLEERIALEGALGL